MRIVQGIIVSGLLLHFALPAHAQWTDGQASQYVVGQSNFTDSSSGTGQQKFLAPNGVAVDTVNNKLYVADTSNNRVLRFAYPITSNDPTAEIVLGQGDFSSNSANTSDSGLNTPTAPSLPSNAAESQTSR